MNYLIIGLGNFGVALATRLTTMGHDVTGVDADIRIVEEYKSQITTTICVNIIDQVSIKALPLDDVDAVIVSLGSHIGESIVIVSLLKQAGVKNIIIDNYRYLDNFADSKEVFDSWDDIVKIIKEYGINLYMFYNLYNECRENSINKKSMYKFTKKFVDSSDYVFMIPAYEDAATAIKVLCYGKDNIEGIVNLDFDKEARLLS